MQQAGFTASRTLLNRGTIEHKGLVTLPGNEMIKKREEPPYWVPHPHSGIYYPQGQERLMDDVPKGAASFGQTYWLRSADGVDKSDYNDN